MDWSGSLPDNGSGAGDMKYVSWSSSTTTTTTLHLRLYLSIDFWGQTTSGALPRIQQQNFGQNNGAKTLEHVFSDKWQREKHQ